VGGARSTGDEGQEGFGASGAREGGGWASADALAPLVRTCVSVGSRVSEFVGLPSTEGRGTRRGIRGLPFAQ